MPSEQAHRAHREHKVSNKSVELTPRPQFLLGDFRSLRTRSLVYLVCTVRVKVFATPFSVLFALAGG